MAVFFLAAIASLAVAVDDQAASPPTPRELRQSISEALRQEATTTGAEHDQALRALVDVFEQLAADRQLPEKSAARESARCERVSRTAQTSCCWHSGAAPGGGKLREIEMHPVRRRALPAATAQAGNSSLMTIPTS